MPATPANGRREATCRVANFRRQRRLFSARGNSDASRSRPRLRHVRRTVPPSLPRSPSNTSSWSPDPKFAESAQPEFSQRSAVKSRGLWKPTFASVKRKPGSQRECQVKDIVVSSARTSTRTQEAEYGFCPDAAGKSHVNIGHTATPSSRTRDGSEVMMRRQTVGLGGVICR